MPKRICLTWILVSTILLTACNFGNQPNRQALPDQQFRPSVQNNDSQTYEQDEELNTLPARFQITSNEEAQEVAERLVTLATKMEKVNDATAVVVGRWAVVGLDLDAALDRAEVGTIKYSVAEALKADPLGAYAIVTADADTLYRLRQMYREIQEGRPVQGIMEELAAIVGRLMPQIPRNIESPRDEQNELNKNVEEAEYP